MRGSEGTIRIEVSIGAPSVPDPRACKRDHVGLGAGSVVSSVTSTGRTYGSLRFSLKDVYEQSCNQGTRSGDADNDGE